MRRVSHGGKTGPCFPLTSLYFGAASLPAAALVPSDETFYAKRRGQNGWQLWCRLRREGNTELTRLFTNKAAAAHWSRPTVRGLEEFFSLFLFCVSLARLLLLLSFLFSLSGFLGKTFLSNCGSVDSLYRLGCALLSFPFESSQTQNLNILRKLDHIIPHNIKCQ